jgi:hypothetical protein
VVRTSDSAVNIVTLLTVVLFATVLLVMLFTTTFCCTSVRGGGAIRPRYRPAYSSPMPPPQNGSPRCAAW